MSSDASAEIWVGCTVSDCIFRLDKLLEWKVYSEEDLDICETINDYCPEYFDYSIPYDSAYEDEMIAGIKISSVDWGYKEINLSELNDKIDKAKKELSEFIDQSVEIKVYLNSSYF